MRASRWFWCNILQLKALLSAGVAGMTLWPWPPGR